MFSRSTRFRRHSPHRHRRSTGSGWQVTDLEPRLMLAADCGQALNACAATASLPTEVGTEGLSKGKSSDVSEARDTSAGIVFVDVNVDDLAGLLDGIDPQFEIVLLDPDRSGIDQITETLAIRRDVQSVHLIAHGRSGEIALGDQRVNRQILFENQQQIRSWSKALSQDADVLIYGCDTAAGQQGKRFLKTLADLTGADVAGSTDKTGSSASNADWILERTVGVIDSPIALSTAGQSVYAGMLPITIRAAGQRGEETMQLLIDEEVVQTWENVSGDFGNRQFETFTVDISGVSADSVRIAFTNDRYEPEIGIDRNLRVDNIEIDGVVYETEDSSVFSTGTFVPGQGITPGFQQSEILHTDGYFQFAGDDTPPLDGAFAIINEIHYNPGPDGEIDGDAEFLELYNPGSEDFDLSGASFTGFDLTFADGTVLGAGQYAIVAPSIEIAESEWGVTPLAQFADGGLSGGGELIQLIAADGSIIDEVEYDDRSPWPGAPDGNGPSLELVNSSLDNTDPANWRASESAPTPAAINSVFSAGPTSDVTDITITPGTPLPGQAFTISANIANATEATLTYKIGFGEDQTVAMVNTQGDLWEAVVPGQEAGELVRYRIDSDVAVAPFEGDTINYFGVVVSPTDIVDNTLPVFQWYVDPDEFEQLVTVDFETNNKIPVVIAYGDQVIDNATVRVRGSFSRTFPKKGFKFELPDGYLLDFAPYANTPVDEFGIVTDFADWTVTSAQIAWETFNAETDSPVSTFFTRVEQNGDFYGIYRFQELYDGTWRTANGFDDGEFYQAEDGAWDASDGFDKKEPDDDDDTLILAARDILAGPASAAKTEWVYDNINVPAAINHMALSALMRHGDQRFQNFYMSLDGETNRWEMLEWDLDLTWRDNADIAGNDGPFTTIEPIGNIYLDAIWEVPEFQAMYWQRLQTLVDTYLSDDRLIERREELLAEIGSTNSALEFEAWGRTDIVVTDFFRDEWDDTIQERRDAFAAETRLPGSSLANPQIVINELHYNPADDDAEFVELYNASDQAVDLSGWQIDGNDLLIENGTVILPGDYVVFTDNDIQFKSQSPGNIYVGGQYGGGLSGGGELITLLDRDGNVVDQVEYDDKDPWPEAPDGDGFTLSLISPDLDNSIATNWAASEAINGTPGAANDVNPPVDPTELRIYAAGITAEETIELEVNGSIVASFTLNDFGSQPGDYFTRDFAELVWVSETPVVPEQVRVYFVNDLWLPDQGIDRNVRIDRIEIDDVVYETEAPTTFSTGTYVGGQRVDPGFLESERLHVDGFFEYLV
ncbi:MAG: DUF4347 domain-containing protein [Planctomycetota bacterium]